MVDGAPRWTSCMSRLDETACDSLSASALLLSCCGDFIWAFFVLFVVVLQNFLRVALQELGSGCTAKTLQVHPYTTTEEVCSLCAYKFKVPDPENYALFLVTDDTSQQLTPDTHPQRIKAELHGRPLAHVFHFVYRKVSNLNLCVPAVPHNGNCLPGEQ